MMVCANLPPNLLHMVTLLLVACTYFFPSSGRATFKHYDPQTFFSVTTLSYKMQFSLSLRCHMLIHSCWGADLRKEKNQADIHGVHISALPAARKVIKRHILFILNC